NIPWRVGFLAAGSEGEIEPRSDRAGGMVVGNPAVVSERYSAHVYAPMLGRCGYVVSRAAAEHARHLYRGGLYVDGALQETGTPIAIARPPSRGLALYQRRVRRALGAGRVGYSPPATILNSRCSDFGRARRRGTAGSCLLVLQRHLNTFITRNGQIASCC